MQPSRRRPLPRVRRLGRQSTPLRRLRHRSTAGCAFCGYRRSSDVRWFGHRSSARSPPRSAAQAATSPGPPTFQTAVRPRPTPQRVAPWGISVLPAATTGSETVASKWSPGLLWLLARAWSRVTRIAVCSGSITGRTRPAVWRQTASTLLPAGSRPRSILQTR